MKDLRELQKRCKRQRDRHFFEDYYRNYEKYKKNYLEACKLLKKEGIKSFELEIPRLSNDEIKVVSDKGKHDATLGNYLTEISENSGKLASYIENVIIFYRNVSRAEAYLKDASQEKTRASTLISNRDWNGSVEASQHSIEHSIKSLFRLVGVEHPFEHDPTEKFEEVVERLDLESWELKQLARIRWLAKVWATIHEESMYAFRDIPAKEFFNEKDAKIIMNYANEVYSASNMLVIRARSGQLKVC